MPAVTGPPSVNMRALLRPLNDNALSVSSEYRRQVCRTQPMRFALCYLAHHLRSPETGNAISFSEFHAALAHSARRWMRDDLGPAEIREAWVAPRSSGKSTWLFLVLPLWAMAYQRRRFLLAFAHAGGQARQHLANLRRELDTNRLLQRDFPELCRPARAGTGTAVANRADGYQAASGVTILAKGMAEASLGAKIGSARPDLIIGDDLERDEGTYSMAQKAKRLATLRQAVLPMNDRAVVVLAGTTTMYGSIMHDLVRSALGERGGGWIAEEGFRCRYFPAITVDGDGTEHSLWPARWSLEYLQSIRHTRGYQLNYANRPSSATGSFWRPEDFTYGMLDGVERRVMRIDPAVSNNRTSDFYGIAVAAATPSDGRVVLELAEQLRGTPEDLRVRVHALLRRNPSIRTVRIEGNQGGLTWRSVLCPLPGGLELEIAHTREGKAELFARVLDYFKRGWVLLGRVFPDFEEQALGWPHVAHDDALDAGCRALDDLLRDRAGE